VTARIPLLLGTDFIVLAETLGLGTWSKNYWADCKKVLFFLSMSVRIFKFQCGPFTKVHYKMSEMAYFIFGYFSIKLAHL
jgi:hypothetical protein